MTTIAPPRPTELPGLPVRLTAGPATVAEARRQVRAALDLWRAPVDPAAAHVSVDGVPVPTAPTHIVRWPSASKSGVTGARASSGPDAKIVS